MAYGETVNSSLNSEFAALPPDSVIFGRSPTMQLLRESVERIKGSNVPVLIQGESGTGKEVIATFLHHRSPWSSGPLVKVNCPGIPSTLLEAELFGHERGSFTGAYESRPGRVEMADRGTLFLDEIAELDPGLQAKLLQLLQNGQFARIGARRDRLAKIRVICATNRRLEKEILTGGFRQDLYYRINVVSVHLPPLRERREDIPALVDYFLAVHTSALSCAAQPVSPALMRLFGLYEWPGNIRQLENLIKRYVILGSEKAINGDLISENSVAPASEVPLGGPGSLKRAARQAALEAQRKVLLNTLQAHEWNCKSAARALGISYRLLFYKMRQVGLPSRNGHRAPG